MIKKKKISIKKINARFEELLNTYLCMIGLPLYSRNGKVFRAFKVDDNKFKLDFTGADYVRRGYTDNGNPLRTTTMLDPDGGPCLTIGSQITVDPNPDGKVAGMPGRAWRIKKFETIDKVDYIIVKPIKAKEMKKLDMANLLTEWSKLMAKNDE